jgi:transposase-like protein
MKGGKDMPRKGYTPEQITGELWEVDPLTQQGHNIAEAVRKVGVSDHTYYVWRRGYGGMGVEQTKRLKELERENTRLKRLVADLSLDKEMLKEALKGNS